MLKNKKIPDEFTFTISDCSSFAQIWKGTYSKRSIVFWFVCIVLFLFTFSFCAIFFTPINRLIPSTKDYRVEQQIIDQAESINNMKDSVALLSQYVSSLGLIMSGDSSYLGKRDTTLVTSKVKIDSSAFQYNTDEKAFRDKMEQKEMYGLLHRTVNNKSNSDFSFYAPLKGLVVKKIDPLDGQYGIEISCKKDEIVHSVLAGTVTLADYSLEDGYTIGIQHGDGYVSYYKHNGALLKKKGDRVQTGDPIAIVGSNGENTVGPNLHFELWKYGEVLDPMQYINFEK